MKPKQPIHQELQTSTSPTKNAQPAVFEEEKVNENQQEDQVMAQSKVRKPPGRKNKSKVLSSIAIGDLIQ